MADDWGASVDEQEKGLTETPLSGNWADIVEAHEQGLSADVQKLKLENKDVVPASGSSSDDTKKEIGSGDAASGKPPGDAASGKPPDSAEGASGEDDEKKTSKEDESLLRKLIHSKLVASKADLEILQKDPNSPLYSVKTFEALNLKPELLKGVYEMGFNAPSKIQETALPTLLADPPTNMIAQSQSGTGKTAAFVLTMLSRVDTSRPYPQCLCLAPTYELALQIGSVTEKMAKHMTDCKIGYAVRGERRKYQTSGPPFQWETRQALFPTGRVDPRVEIFLSPLNTNDGFYLSFIRPLLFSVLRTPVSGVGRGQKSDHHILIGTPGTVCDWCLKHKSVDLRKITVFVLDEADVMIATQGHQDQSIRIQRGLSKTCQMLLFSATYEEEVMRFAQAVIPNSPVIIKLRREEESLDNIKQFYIDCQDKEDKFRALSNIYGTISIGQSMIFCDTRRTAHWLAEKMSQDGHAVALLSGELEITQRAAVITRFRDGKEKVLITTNVSARGIDVEMVTVVVNFDLPLTQDRQADCETYLHRIGRTGRFGKAGLAINMVDSKRAYGIMRTIEKHFNRTIEKLDADDMEAIEKIST